jgi:hypothetical protein
MADPAELLTVQFLEWLARSPRRYAEVKEAWRSTCPRLSIWEDAQARGLIGFAHEGSRVGDGATVVLTPLGRAMIDGGAPHTQP